MIVALCNKEVKVMAVRETIAIAGATGKAGSAIARKLAPSNYRLLLISRHINRAIKLSAAIQSTTTNAETEAIDCLKDGCWEADIIVLAVPVEAEKEVAEKIKEVATQKIIVRLSPAENNTSFSSKYSNALEQLLAYSKIVTVFINTALSGETVIAGSSNEAVDTIVNIASKAGFTLNP